MGCSCSKVDDQRAVVLCRGRADLLATAVRHRFALAAAHDDFAASLLSFSDALHRVLLVSSSSAAEVPSSSTSPVLPLPPPSRKLSPSPPPPPHPHPHPPISSGRRRPHSHSHSGSHIHLLPSDTSDSSDGDESVDEDYDDDDEEEEEGAGGDHFPFHYQQAPLPVFGYAGGVYYARTQPPPNSISVQQRPPRNETVQFVSSSANDTGAAAASSSSSFNPYSSYGYGFPEPYSYFSTHFAQSAAGQPPAQSATGMAAPPPPSPPRESAWDFLNPFHSYEGYYGRSFNYNDTPSRSSKELREEEGIPDLEEIEPEIVKEAYADRGFVRRQHSSMAPSPLQYQSRTTSMRESSYNFPPSYAAGNRSSGYQSRTMEKNAASNHARQLKPEQSKAAATEAAAVAATGVQDASEVAELIKAQFERASQSARELSALLEVGKKQYLPRNSLYEVSSKVVGVVAPSTSFRKHEGLLNFEEEKMIDNGSIASTLRKLYIWERKLYHEVKAEEKMRLLLNRSHRELARLDQIGSEALKIDSTRDLIKKLSTKVRISIQVAGSISKKISKLRDEELWPLIYDLFQGLAMMWTILLDCHRMQLQVVSEAKVLDSIVSYATLSETHANDILQLEIELLRWKGNFSAWVNAQKNYVKALNGWLILCLSYEPKGTSNHTPPNAQRVFSAPPLFVISSCWSQALEKVSEGEVVDAMDALAATVHNVWEHQNLEQHERITARRDLDRQIRAIEKKTQVVHKETNLLNKKMALVPGHTNFSSYQHVHGRIMEASTVQVGLRQIFKSIESFFSSTVEAYEEVDKRLQEGMSARDSFRVP